MQHIGIICISLQIFPPMTNLDDDDVKSLSRVRLFATPWTVAHQAPPSMGFTRQEYWSGLPFPSPGDRPNPGIEPRSPALQADSLSAETQDRNAVQTTRVWCYIKFGDYKSS